MSSSSGSGSSKMSGIDPLSDSGNMALPPPDVDRRLNFENLDTQVMYSCPTFQVVSSSGREPQLLEFGAKNKSGFSVYHDCAWVHATRKQHFLPGKTVLAVGGKVGCLYICPVLQMIDRQWLFLCLGTPGYALFAVRGRKIGQTKRWRPFVDASELADEVTWVPPPVAEGALDAFLATLENPTWKAGKEVSSGE